jgi:hypothetical protein
MFPSENIKKLFLIKIIKYHIQVEERIHRSYLTFVTVLWEVHRLERLSTFLKNETWFDCFILEFLALQKCETKPLS